MKDRRLSLRCHAKVNLQLRVLGLRPDGYHEIRSVLQAIDLHDTLEARPAPSLALTVRVEEDGAGGLEVPGDASNLVLKAAHALRRHLAGRGASFTLTKRIPAGSGLGGASSDAAAALLALDRLHALRLDPGELHRAAASIGSDVPFFLYGGAALALGRGEEVYPLPDGPALHVAVVFGEVGLATPEVYRTWDGLLTSSGKTSRMSDFAPWCLVLRGARPSVANDLEEAAVGLRPSLRSLRSVLEESKAEAISMTGSGSAFFGVFRDAGAAAEAARRARGAGYRAVAARSLGRGEWERALWAGG